MTTKDDIISVYSDHDPEEWEAIKKEMGRRTGKKLASMKQVIINSVLNEKKEKKKVIPLDNKWRREAIINSVLNERK